MPFIHFIEILLQDYVLASSFERVTSESHYTNRSTEMHSIETIQTMLMMITPKMPRSRHPKLVKLLGKVDRFPSFLLEMAHAEDADANAPHVATV
jgi:hypothetical protein